MSRPEALDEGGALRSGQLVWMWNRPQIQAVNGCEIGRIAGEERKIVGERHGGDQCVVGPGTGLPSGSVREARTTPGRMPERPPHRVSDVERAEFRSPIVG